MRFILNLLLTAVALFYIFPHLEGVGFAGSIGSALGFALLLTGSTWFSKQVARALALTLGFTTLLPGMLILIPLALLGMWLLPAAELMLLADFFPKHLALDGWTTAFLASLVIFIINAFTHKWSDTLKKPCDCSKKW